MLPSSNHISPQDYLHASTQALQELETVTRLRSHAVSAGFHPVLDEADHPCDGVVVRTREGRDIYARRLIIATGQHDHLHSLPGASELWGTHLLHCPYCHGWEARDQSLLVIAMASADNPAAPMVASYQALYLRQRLSEDVTLVSPSLPQDDFAAALDHAGVQVVLDTPTRISRSDDAVPSVVLECENVQLSADLAFCAPPTSAGSALGEQLGLEMQGPAIVVDHQQRSSHPLVFAAGDGCVPRGMAQPMTFVSQAQAHGQLAGLWADQDLFFALPSTPAFPTR